MSRPRARKGRRPEDPLLLADRRLTEAQKIASPYRHRPPPLKRKRCRICDANMYGQGDSHAQCLYLEAISAVPGAGEVKEPRSDIETGRDGDAGRH